MLSVVVWREFSLNGTVRLRDLSAGGLEVLKMSVNSLAFLKCHTLLINYFIETMLLIVSFTLCLHSHTYVGHFVLESEKQ